MNTPLVSVVVPVHNGAHWLGETLVSLSAQTYPHFEIILVNDASTDNLTDVLNRHHDDRLHVVHLEKNVGVSAARNQGIEEAKGDFIAFCDADDLCMPYRFVRQVEFLMKNADVQLCGSAFTCFDTEDRETVMNPTADATIKMALTQGNCFGLSTVMARAKVLKENRFSPTLVVAEDYDLWTRLAAAGAGLANLPESLIRYRWHEQQASRDKSAHLDQAARKIRGLYCAGLLGDQRLLERLRLGLVDLNDLDIAARKIVAQTVYESRVFRFMLAWIYQQLPQHGVRSWRRWIRIQKQLQLRLDENYRLNVALLAFLPIMLTRKYFDTLIKLKR